MGVNLSSLVKMLDDTDKIITKPFYGWLLEHSDDGYSEEIAQLLYRLHATVPRDRRFSFSASSAGSCLRAQLFSYIGTPSVYDTDPELQNLFSDGKWRHLRWQANLLSAGLLTDVEVPGYWKKYRAKGSMDGQGIVSDDHPRQGWRGKKFGFELKGVNPFLYAKIKNAQEEQTLPAYKIEHKRQVHRYFLMNGDIELFVIIYEDKATQKWIEWVIEPEDEFLKASEDELKELNTAVNNQQFPPILEACGKGKGELFNYDCPFGTLNGPCIKIKTHDWPREPKKRVRVRKP